MADRCDDRIEAVRNELFELGWFWIVDESDENIVGVIKKTKCAVVYRDMTARQMERHPDWKWLDR